MFCVENSEKIAKYVLLSVLCFDSVFSAAILTAQRLRDDKDESIYGEDEDEVIYGEYQSEEDNSTDDGDVLHLDFFRFTTRKRYIWEDWTVPTRDPGYYRDSSSSSDSGFVLYLIVTLFIAGVVCTILYICIKKVSESDSNSATSARRFTTVHPPPQRRSYLSTQVHGPPIGTNQFSDSRRELFGELDRHAGTVRSTGASTSFVNFRFSESTEDRRVPDNTVSEKPPDYSTVTLNDLVNPTQPAFPVVKSDNETPPPEYGKENPLFK